MPIEQIELLLLVAALVAMVSRLVRLPYTVGLVLSGVALSFLPAARGLSVTKDLLFSTLLPPLIFEAALFLPWRSLRQQLPVVLLMASAGVLLAAAVTMLGMHVLADWPLVPAAIFGVLIAATDPVSVIATFKEMRVTGRLRLLVEAESLFNDGTAAVFFGLLLAVADGAAVTLPGLLGNMLWIVGGALACGALFAAAALLLASRTRDHLVEVTLTTVAAYGSFLLAEHVHCSGVLATLTAGLVVGSRRHAGGLSRSGREATETFWEFAAFVANSLIFLLIGLEEARQDLAGEWRAALVAILVVLLGRMVAIYPLALVFSRGPLRLPRAYQHVMVWGGLRGALALALALGLPETLPYRAAIVSVAFAVVAFSVIVQGLTMTPLMRRLGLLPAPTARDH